MKIKIVSLFFLVVVLGMVFLTADKAAAKPKIAVFSGPQATILNSEPLVNITRPESNTACRSLLIRESLFWRNAKPLRKSSGSIRSFFTH
jgi:hypothetical protein